MSLETTVETGLDSSIPSSPEGEPETCVKEDELNDYEKKVCRCLPTGHLS